MEGMPKNRGGLRLGVAARIADAPAVAERRSAGTALWRDLSIGISLGSLCYCRVWSELLTYTASGAYEMKLPPSPAALSACIVNVLLVAGLLTLLIRVARRERTGAALRFARWAFLVFLLLPFNAVRNVAARHVPYVTREELVAHFGATAVCAAALGVAAVTVLTFVRWQRQIVQLAAGFVSLLTVFAALVIGQALWRIATYDPGPWLDRPLAPRLAHAKRFPRVVWVISDEWDQRLTFVDRLAGLRLPELDSFRSSSLYADNAYPPAGRTINSVAGLIQGELVADFLTPRPDQLLLISPPGRPLRFGDRPNVFSLARDAGFNTGLVGFYHPYGRLLNESLSFCWWGKASWQGNSMGETFGEILLHQARSLFETEQRSLFGRQSLALHDHSRTCRDIWRISVQLVADPEMGFIFLHVPVTHDPHTYDRTTGEFTNSSPVAAYWDGLVALDRILGDLRRSMETAGLLGRTTVLLTPITGTGMRADSVARWTTVCRFC